MNDKLDRLLEAIEHPDRFSDQELDQLLADEETRALYNTMCSASEALAEPVEPDVDREWAAFVGKAITRRSLLQRLGIHRRVAVVAAIMVVSLAVVATTFVLATSKDFSAPAVETESVVAPAATATPVVPELIPEDTPADLQPAMVVFNGEPLEEIINSICAFYGASAAINNEAAKELRLYFRWNQADSLTDVAEQLGSFEQINIALSGNTLTIK